jgi:hypothetical protein
VIQRQSGPSLHQTPQKSFGRRRDATRCSWNKEESKPEREKEKLEKERRRIAAMEIAVARQRVCIRARQNLHI